MPDLSVKIDELLLVLSDEILSDTSKSHYVCQVFHEIMQYRTKELHKQEASAELVTMSKHLISNLRLHGDSIFGNISSECERTSIFILKVLELSFENVLGDDSFCQDYIQSLANLLDCENSKAKIQLTVFECFLNAFISVEDLEKGRLSNTLNLLNNVNLLGSLTHLVIDYDNNDLSSFCLHSIIPKLVKVTNTYLIVEMIWSELKLAVEKSPGSLSKQLFILCGLANFLHQKTCNVSIIESTEFWKLIQEGLVSSDTLVRKQALYILKRAVDIIVTLNLTLNVELFSWDSMKSDMLLKTWGKMFILFEVLEEKQAHLVIPVIQSLLRATDLESTIHFSWLLAGYIRMLSHETLQVIKLGIRHFFERSIYIFSSTYRTTGIIEILFKKLNNMLLYHSHTSQIEWSEIDISLRDWFKSISSHPKLSEELIPEIINAMVKVQWCAIPLFHVVYNFSLASAVSIFSDEDLLVLNDFLSEAIKTQNVFIRGAVQCVILNLIAKGTKNSVNVVHTVQILNVFRQKECLARGLKSWEIARGWISSQVRENDEIMNLLFMEKNNLSVEARARSLVLFVDSNLIDPKETKFQKAIKDYFCVLEDTFKRPYSSSVESDKCLKFIFHILKEFKTEFSGPFQQGEPLINSLSPYLKESISYIHKRLLEVNKIITDYEIIELYVNVLQVTSDFEMISFEEAVNLAKISKRIGCDPESHPVQQVLALKIIVWFIRLGSERKEKEYAFEQIKDHCLLIIKNDYLKLNISKSKSDELLSRNHQVHWGWLLSGYVCTIWSVIQECLDKNIVSKDEILGLTSANDIIQLATNSIESGGRESLVPVLNVVKYIFSEASVSCSLCQRFLQFSWKTCFELRKIALFWPSIKAWIELTFNQRLITMDGMEHIINEFSEEILHEGEAVNGLCNVFMFHLRQELKSVNCAKILLPVITKALVFGLVPRKDQRIESDTYTLIGNMGSALSVNDLIPHPGYGNSHQVRLCGLSVLLGVSGQDGGTEVVVSAVKQLMELDNQLSAKRQRYHGDSLHHRIKHRILQSILVLHQIIANSSSPLAKSCVVELVKWSSAGLQGESQQPSVRYQLEWLLCRTLLLSPELLPSFWTMFNESSEERAGSVCSFISIAYHVAATLRDTEFTERCVSEVLPWCMAQQFNIRLYAQVVLDKLWLLDPQVASKYSVVRSSLTKSLNRGNTMRNVEKLKKDFYFTIFHPLEHFTLETIFRELPRLSNISRDEWIPLSTIQDSLSNYESFLPLKNPDDSLSQYEPPSWVAKATAETEFEVEALAMQKKFVPWKNMFPEIESSSSRTQLIVVASLIDKLPNLGGLTRTCEIFAAECLVVPSLEFTRDKMFSTLSMTAEKHINIVEVKPYDLPKYLREKKNSGYTVVGAEQTASSVSLESYKFPKKCLLLLGNEKEGVPVNLLPLLDVCVEVPQLGVVRSLNVHVTGALFIWEYTKQYLDTSNVTGGAT